MFRMWLSYEGLRLKREKGVGTQLGFNLVEDLLKFDVGALLKSQAGGDSGDVGAGAFSELESETMIGALKGVGVEMHRIAEPRLSEVLEGKLGLHVRDEVVLRDKDKMFIHVLKSLHFVVELNEDGFGGHFPIHTEALRGKNVLVSDREAVLLEESLSFRPDGSGGI